ncbi:PH domain-containing protein [Amycolatopsis sp. lyj-109]|uniref:PH domain-containing protein n=1 Tax=Amycolatopsis sp. lyj-109 TaxID=2789287 RepID=UPI0039796D74
MSGEHGRGTEVGGVRAEAGEHGRGDPALGGTPAPSAEDRRDSGGTPGAEDRRDSGGTPGAEHRRDSGGTPAGWRRLDRRTLGVTAVLMAGVAVSAGSPIALGTRSLWLLPAAALLVGVGVLAEYVRWRHTRFRCTAERLEIDFRFAVHTRKSLPRERIRSADLTANPLHRAFGVAALTIGTGQQERITLSPLARADAEALRAELLHRLPEPSTQDGPLATLDPRWIRYAPVSFVAPTLGLAAFGTLFRVADWFGAGGGLLKWLLGLFGDLPLAVGLLLLAGLALVAGVTGAVGLFTEMWWHYRLDREPGGTLRVRRGLLTTRSITVAERRLRGVELVEPLGARLAGAARVDAIATGLHRDDDKTESKTLLPAAPKAVAQDVVAQVLGERIETVELVAHPVAARGRRLRWASAAALGPVLVLLVLGALLTDVLLVLGGLLAVVALPVAVLLALDAYRGLGHGSRGRYLVTRAGSIRRGTAVLTRDGVIGWTVKQSVFQRRRGLATFTATTAAGSGAYAIRDAAAGEGLEFAAAAVPGVLTPFLEGSAPAEASRT